MVFQWFYHPWTITIECFLQINHWNQWFFDGFPKFRCDGQQWFWPWKRSKTAHNCDGSYFATTVRIISDLKSSDDAGAGPGDDGGGDVDAGGKTLHLGQLVWIAVYVSQLDQSRGQLFKKMIVKRKDRMTSEAGSRSQECENIVFVKENLPWLHF